MSERGGSAAQSGILYQNSVAALYLARSLDTRTRPDADRVVHVRIEAPAKVDDTIIAFADGHRAYVQAKESLSRSDRAWQGLWRAFDAQFRDDAFRRGTDRLCLHVGSSYLGSSHHTLLALQKLCERAAHSADYQEWWTSRLTKAQQSLVSDIKPYLSPEMLNDVALLTFFSHVDVEIRDLVQIERDMVPDWMPPSNKQPKELFRLLRDLVADKARRRGSHTPRTLRRVLETEGTRLLAQPDMMDLRVALDACGSMLRLHKYTFAGTKRHVKRTIVDDIITWATQAHDDTHIAMLVDQAGTGKSVVMADVLRALHTMDIAVLAIKADQQLSGVISYDDLPARLHLPDMVEHVVGRLAALGSVVVMIDQIDALSLSLARDQQTLDVALEMVARLQVLPDVRILLSCRTFDRSGDPRLSRIEVGRTFTLLDLSDEEMQTVLHDVQVNLDTLASATKRLLRVPLHLDLFARAIEERRTPPAGDMLGVTTLQELYTAVWRAIVLKPAPDGPPMADREEVLRVLTEYMDRAQRTTAPRSIFATTTTAHLDCAAQWLASAGILVVTTQDWSFLHQTFFDYCYAKAFVERGASLANTIMQGEQGLFARPQIVQVMSYLRGSDRRRCVQELHALLTTTTVRYHLQDLLLRWFGALRDPTDDEWLIARRFLSDAAMRPRLLVALQGSKDWFGRLLGAPLRDLLAQDDAVVDGEVIPYLASLVDIAQADIVASVGPYLSRSDVWNHRVASLIVCVRRWQAAETADLFERLMRIMPTHDSLVAHQLADVTAVYPQVGCRAIRAILDSAVARYTAKRNADLAGMGESYMFSLSITSLHNELQALNTGMFHDALERASRKTPRDFLDAMLPWLINVLNLAHVPHGARPLYGSDELSYGWNDPTFGVQYALMSCFVAAMSAVARTEPEAFREFVRCLVLLPQLTPQQLVARVYCDAPALYTDDALQFLLADRRRLDLGGADSYDTRRLISAIYPYLANHQRAALEIYILTDPTPPRARSLGDVRFQKLSRLYLLQAIPSEYRSEHTLRRLRELERALPGAQAAARPIRMIAGIMESPIALDCIQHMSNKNWLNAMRKYHGSATHPEPLKGGAAELASLLMVQVRENPRRFYRLALRMPLTVDASYTNAIMQGLAEADAPAEWLFDIVRRVASRPGSSMVGRISWALQKRIAEGLPPDLMAMLEAYVRGASEDHQGQDPDSAYLNSDRGSALNALMRGFDQQQTSDTDERRWSLLTFAATDPSTSLRAGAIIELLYLLHDSRDQVTALFERLMDGHPALLRSRMVQEFLYYALYKHYGPVKLIIRAN